MSGERNPLEQLVDTVRASAKYGSVCTGIVRRVAAQELARGGSFRAAVKATKRKLHQVAGAYLDAGVHYVPWLEELRRASRSGDVGALRAACRRIMGYHASTRERLPILDNLYATCLAGLPPIRSVLDVGCGLHPLAIPWMPLAEGAVYVAVDIYEDLAAFLNGFLELLPVQGRAEVRDVLGSDLPDRVDLALLLKIIPCLEQVDREAGRRLLDSIPANWLLVSFPVATLGGRRDRGMPFNYEAHFWELVAGRDWPVERFEFGSELVFRVDKGGQGGSES